MQPSILAKTTLLTALAVGAALGANALLAELVALPVSEHAMSQRPVVPEPIAVRVPGEAEYLDRILGRNLFDPDAIARWDGAPTKALGRADLDVRLIGTVVATTPEHSAAFLIDERASTSEALGYSIGHTIQDAEIVAIDTLQVTVLRADGRRQVLVTEPEEASAGAARAGADGDRVVVDKAILDGYLADPGAIARLGRSRPHRGADGEIDGYRLILPQDSPLTDQLGIRSGDVIHSVNGRDLTSGSSTIAAYQALQGARDLTLELTRNGRPMTLDVAIRGE